MKNFVHIILCLVVCKQLVAQQPAEQQPAKPINYQRPYPKSIIELGVGVGPNFGIIGGQLVVGYKGCGVLGALGGSPGGMAYAIGLQVSSDWFYFNVSRAVVGSQTYGSGFYEETRPTIGTVIMIGGKINLLKAKTLYLQLGVGYQFSSVRDSFLGITTDTSGPTFAAGIGYRIAFKKQAATNKPYTKLPSDNGF